jgi:phage gpG-like protein
LESEEILMPGVVIEFEAFGHKQIVRELERFADFAGDAAPAWEKIIDLMREDIQEQFDSEGQSMSGGWAPLKPVTIERKAALGLSPEIMRATDRLMQSLTDERGGDQVHEVTPHGFDFGSKVDYGKYHMGPAKDGSRPARPPIDFTEAQRRKYVKVLQTYLMGGEI